MPGRFLDTNVLLRYLTGDDAPKAQRALDLLRRVERGEERIETSALVVFETIFTLQHQYSVSRAQIRDMMSDIISLRGLTLAGKAGFRRALDLYASSNLSFADAYNVTYIEQRALAEIYSWDTDFDRVAGIGRVEP